MSETTIKVLTGLLSAAAGGLVGALAGWVLGRRTKLIEYRVDLFQRASRCYFRAVSGIGICMRAVQEVELGNGTAISPVTMPRIDRAFADLDGSLAESRALGWVMVQVFSEETVGLWREVCKAIDANRSIEPTEWKEIDHAAWRGFVKGAGQECGFKLIGRLWPKVREVLTAGSVPD